MDTEGVVSTDDRLAESLAEINIGEEDDVLSLPVFLESVHQNHAAEAIPPNKAVTNKGVTQLACLAFCLFSTIMRVGVSSTMDFSTEAIVANVAFSTF